MASVAAAYTAAHGHPMEHDGGVAQEARRRRWSVTLRTSLGAVAVVLVVVAGVVLTDLARSTGEPITLGAADPEVTDAREEPTAVVSAPSTVAPSVSPPGNTDGGTVLIHVVGQVVSPGVVQVPQGARLVDAIAAAGGLTAEADTASVNLAREVVDGEQIYVPTPGEDPSTHQVPGPVPTTTGAGSPGAVSQAAGPVNINTADLATLDSLPGIGPSLAQRILDWRTDNGAFVAVDELQEVSGIGPAVMAGLRDLVTV